MGQLYSRLLSIVGTTSVLVGIIIILLHQEGAPYQHDYLIAAMFIFGGLILRIEAAIRCRRPPDPRE